MENDHNHNHTHGANKRLLISFIIITSYMIVEGLVVSLLTVLR